MIKAKFYLSTTVDSDFIELDYDTSWTIYTLREHLFPLLKAKRPNCITLSEVSMNVAKGREASRPTYFKTMADLDRCEEFTFVLTQSNILYIKLHFVNLTDSFLYVICPLYYQMIDLRSFIRKNLNTEQYKFYFGGKELHYSEFVANYANENDEVLIDVENTTINKVEKIIPVEVTSIKDKTIKGVPYMPHITTKMFKHQIAYVFNTNPKLINLNYQSFANNWKMVNDENFDYYVKYKLGFISYGQVVFLSNIDNIIKKKAFTYLPKQKIRDIYQRVQNCFGIENKEIFIYLSTMESVLDNFIEEDQIYNIGYTDALRIKFNVFGVPYFFSIVPTKTISHAKFIISQYFGLSENDIIFKSGKIEDNMIINYVFQRENNGINIILKSKNNKFARVNHSKVTQYPSSYTIKDIINKLAKKDTKEYFSINGEGIEIDIYDKKLEELLEKDDILDIEITKNIRIIGNSGEKTEFLHHGKLDDFIKNIYVIFEIPNDHQLYYYSNGKSINIEENFLFDTEEPLFAYDLVLPFKFNIFTNFTNTIFQVMGNKCYKDLRQLFADKYSCSPNDCILLSYGVESLHEFKDDDSILDIFLETQGSMQFYSSNLVNFDKRLLPFIFILDNQNFVIHFFSEILVKGIKKKLVQYFKLNRSTNFDLVFNEQILDDEKSIFDLSIPINSKIYVVFKDEKTKYSISYRYCFSGGSMICIEFDKDPTVNQFCQAIGRKYETIDIYMNFFSKTIKIEPKDKFMRDFKLPFEGNSCLKIVEKQEHTKKSNYLLSTFWLNDQNQFDMIFQKYTNGYEVVNCAADYIGKFNISLRTKRAKRKSNDKELDLNHPFSVDNVEYLILQRCKFTYKSEIIERFIYPSDKIGSIIEYDLGKNTKNYSLWFSGSTLGNNETLENIDFDHEQIEIKKVKLNQ